MKSKSPHKAAEPSVVGITDEQGIPFEPNGSRSAEQDIIAVHKARLADWSPSAVTAASATADGTVLAVARESGNVELWQTEHWTISATLLGSEDMALTSLAWLQEHTTGLWRLFSGGLDGSLTEWHLLERRCKQRTDALGGAVWAVAARPQCEGISQAVAAACDDGTLRLFEMEEGEPGLLYQASMPHVDGRLLSVAWHPKGKIAIVGTSQGMIHAWDTVTKRELLRIQAGDERQLHQDVWCVGVMADGVMVSGDSGGNVQFWDPAHGTLISGFRQHQADVLTIAASSEGDTLFACGADPQVAIYKRVSNSSGLPPKWEYLESKRPHSHDVRALAVISMPQYSEVLISGGNDALLFAYRIQAFSKEHPIQLSKAPEAPYFGLANIPEGDRPPILMCSQRNTCTLWRLGSSEEPEANSTGPASVEGRQLELVSAPQQIADVSTTDKGHILTSAISSDGRYLVIVDSTEIQLYELKQIGDDGMLSLHRLRVDCVDHRVWHAAAFARSQLILASPKGGIIVIDVVTDQKVGEINAPCLGRRGPSTAASQLIPNILSMTAEASSDLVAVHRAYDVQILDLKTMSNLGAIRNPLEKGPIAVVAFSAAGQHLAVGTASNALILYHPRSRLMAEVSQGLRDLMEAKLPKMPGSLNSISFLPESERIAVVISTSTCLCYIDFQAAAPPLKPRHKKLRRLKEDLLSESGANVRIIPVKQICFGFHFTSKSAAVLVEKNWTSVQQKFPPPVYRHRFGT